MPRKVARVPDQRVLAHLPLRVAAPREALAVPLGEVKVEVREKLKEALSSLSYLGTTGHLVTQI